MDPLRITGYGQSRASDNRQQIMPVIQTARGEGAGRSGRPDSAAVSPSPPSPKGIQLPEDRVELSGVKPDEKASANPTGQSADGSKTKAVPGESPKPESGEKTTKDGKSLEDPQVQQQISKLKANEEKVKAHEAAHKAVGGNLASNATYSYTQGPDGRSYITGGEVQIDMSSGKTPEETISRMQQVIRAALAPADPSGQDRAVASQAASIMAQAQQQKAQADNPAREPEPGEEVDPVKEAMRKALDPEAKKKAEEEEGAAATSADSVGSQARRAYADPAVKGSPADTETGPNNRSQYSSRFSSQKSMISSISSFA